MSRPMPRTLTLLQKQYVTQNMLRLTFGSPNLSGFPEDQESGYVKLMFPSENGGTLMRTYTIRHQRADEIDIDFAIHGDSGIACHWALHAEIGEELLIGGPGPKKLISEDADWLLFIGDMTALPAISVNLSKLPKDTQGFALLEVQSEADIQPLIKPEGVTIEWLVNPHPGSDDQAFVNHLKTIQWPEGSVSVWAACEFSSMRNLRAYFKQHPQVSKPQMYISSYWKQGLNEDQHKVEKRIDMDEHEG